MRTAPAPREREGVEVPPSTVESSTTPSRVGAIVCFWGRGGDGEGMWARIDNAFYGQAFRSAVHFAAASGDSKIMHVAQGSSDERLGDCWEAMLGELLAHRPGRSWAAWEDLVFLHASLCLQSHRGSPGKPVPRGRV